MNSRNVCKFTASHYCENLSVSCFVLESDKAIMQKVCTLPTNRIMLIIDASGTVSIESQTFSLCKGQLLFGFRGERIVFDLDDCKYMYIDFDGLRAEELIKRFNINKANRSFVGFDGIIPLWEEGLMRAMESNIDLVAESVVLYTFSRMNSDISRGNNVLNSVLSITEQQFSDFELSLSTIAKELGYNSKYLSHLFKEKMNISYCEYLRCLRIKYATSLFNSGLDSIKNVALLSGFSDPLYFSTTFKKVMGVSPKKYIHELCQKN